jgi:hypothetical protein
MTKSKMTELPTNRREEWDRLVEAFEWLEDHCWVCPEREAELRRERAAKAAIADIRTASPPASSPKLTAEFLREASKLATEWAEADARLMLARKARQVAELDHRRGLRLVVDNTKIAPPQA